MKYLIGFGLFIMLVAAANFFGSITKHILRHRVPKTKGNKQ